eukprot:CAMPEP_0176216326 /NCGR_PEP_ID=MMETSP0121_2-20121125/17134_1 /TAXON_ID=160619 /ORGANISM="Kryptoperidinium foliaceum, Strain CCMP 1326" /LENGTH=72 /DNA_ID=CAMNT_0017555451 /DNA_START=1 /DNA_END=219 /DNA_ORIENTATION=-
MDEYLCKSSLRCGSPGDTSGALRSSGAAGCTGRQRNKVDFDFKNIRWASGGMSTARLADEVPSSRGAMALRV